MPTNKKKAKPVHARRYTQLAAAAPRQVGYGLLVLCLLTKVSVAQIAHGWALYGVAEDGTHLFYSSKDVHKLPGGHVEVWSKGLASKDVEREARLVLGDKARVQRMAANLAVSAPPISHVKNLTEDQVDTDALAEEVANHSELNPVMKILWEIDCPARLIRTLSTHIVKNDKTSVSEEAGDWMHVTPESNGETLLALLCGQ